MNGAFKEPLAQVRGALTNTAEWYPYEGRRVCREVLAALDRVERLAADMETALQRIAEPIPVYHDEDWHGYIDEAINRRDIARAVLSAREEGADTR